MKHYDVQLLHRIFRTPLYVEIGGHIIPANVRRKFTTTYHSPVCIALGVTLHKNDLNPDGDE